MSIPNTENPESSPASEGPKAKPAVVVAPPPFIVVVLGVATFCVMVTLAVKLGMRAALETAPSASVSESEEGPKIRVFKKGEEFALILKDNFFISAARAGDLRDFFFQKSVQPQLELAHVKLNLSYLQGGTRVRVVADDLDLVRVLVLDGGLAGSEVFLSKIQLPDAGN